MGRGKTKKHKTKHPAAALAAPQAQGPVPCSDPARDPGLLHLATLELECEVRRGGAGRGGAGRGGAGRGGAGRGGAAYRLSGRPAAPGWPSPRACNATQQSTMHCPQAVKDNTIPELAARLAPHGLYVNAYGTHEGGLGDRCGGLAPVAPAYAPLCSATLLKSRPVGPPFPPAPPCSKDALAAPLCPLPQALPGQPVPCGVGPADDGTDRQVPGAGCNAHLAAAGGAGPHAHAPRHPAAL